MGDFITTLPIWSATAITQWNDLALILSIQNYVAEQGVLKIEVS